MKLAIIGSRSLTNIDISPYIPEGVTEIVTGGATGIDSLAEAYADSQKLSKHIIRPRYQIYLPKIAPLERNKLIVHDCDVLLAFWDCISSGTLYTIRYAETLGKPFRVIELNSSNISKSPKT